MYASHPELGQVTSGPADSLTRQVGRQCGLPRVRSGHFRSELVDDVRSDCVLVAPFQSGQVGSGQVGLGNSRHFNHHDNVDKTILT